MIPLKDFEIYKFIENYPEWSYSHKGRLEKTFEFQNFARAMIFVNRIVNPIEEARSYPLIRIAYNRVLVSLFDHTKGCLTETELKMALEMDALKK